MRTTGRWATFVVGAVVVAVAAMATSSATAADTEKPVAGEIGITADEIRIAIVADVDTPLSPGVFQAQVDAVQGYARYVNKRGGVAGRKLAVEFIDSKLNPDESRVATITACSNDFAMVGTAAVFLTNADDMNTCADSSGAPTGLPDIPSVIQDVAQQCSPVSFSVAPSSLVCSTKDDSVKRYRTNLGQARYYAKKYSDLHGICIGQSDLKSTATTGQVVCDGLGKLGVELDGDGFYGVSARAPQTVFTPLVATAKSDAATYIFSLMSDAQAISLRREAKLQGLNTVEVWDCSRSCYSKQFLKGGADVEGQYVPLSTLPLEETKSNKALAAYVKTVGRSKVNGFGELAWVAAILFHETIDRIVARDGVNGITRARFLQELSTTKDFDARGMLGSTDIAARRPSPCYALLQVRSEKFVRVNPKKPGTFDCNPKNLANVKLADQ
jgi:ABC-type branched-subunit amino acid transport system substrate-binding protein